MLHVDEIDTYQSALSAAEAELEETLDEYQRLGDRLNALRQTVLGLRSLVGAPAPANAGPFLNGPVIGSFHNVTLTDSGAGTDSVTAVRARTTIEKVVHIVDQAGRPMKISEIIEQFDLRNWVEPSWKRPDATIRQAIRRAADDEHLVMRLSGRRIVALALAEKYANEVNTEQNVIDIDSEDEE